jgi:hypothetical protein
MFYPIGSQMALRLSAYCSFCFRQLVNSEVILRQIAEHFKHIVGINMTMKFTRFENKLSYLFRINVVACVWEGGQCNPRKHQKVKERNVKNLQANRSYYSEFEFNVAFNLCCFSKEISTP